MSWGPRGQEDWWVGRQRNPGLWLKPLLSSPASEDIQDRLATTLSAKASSPDPWLGPDPGKGPGGAQSVSSVLEHTHTWLREAVTRVQGTGSATSLFFTVPRRGEI